MAINAKSVYYRELNEQIRTAVKKGQKEIILDNVNGQYFIGAGLSGDARIVLNGVPGNDLAAFMDGPTLVVNGNAQDNISNTMNSGKVIVNGNGGDVLGYGMRGGKLHIRGDVGYRVGIHMKGYKNFVPAIIAGGCAGEFFGEYMAGGVLILLGLNRGKKPIVGDYVGSGMHGGVMFIRGEVSPSQCGKEVGISELTEEDEKLLRGYLIEYCQDFSLNIEDVMKEKFVKLTPMSSRPYGNMYCCFEVPSGR